MKPVDMESAMVVTDYLFSELISANLFLKKNPPKQQDGPMVWNTFINI